MRTLAKLACYSLLLIPCASLRADSTPQEDRKSAPNGCQVKRTILADGTMEIQNQDCSITRKTKAQVLTSTEGDQASAQPVEGQQSTNTTKLREMKPMAPPVGEADATMHAKYIQAMDGYFDYYASGYSHRQQVFEWQLISSKIIFVLVVLLVVSGVYFAAIQFHDGMRRKTLQAGAFKASGAAPQENRLNEGQDPTVTTFSASAKGIEISSPVLGVIILVISLAFFYLYLVYIFPITELF